MTYRRDFLKKSILSTAGIGIGTMGMSAKSYASIKGANDRFRVAVCGVNGRGKSHIKGFDEQDNVEIAYLVDPDSHILDSRVKQLRENGKNSKKVTGITDVRKALDDKDIDNIDDNIESVESNVNNKRPITTRDLKTKLKKPNISAFCIL